jgi:hypothetical protein
MFELEEEQPTTSAQALSTSNEEFGYEMFNINFTHCFFRETSANNSAELQDDDDPSEKVVRALMNYFKDKNNGSVEPLMQIPYLDAPENVSIGFKRYVDAIFSCCKSITDYPTRPMSFILLMDKRFDSGIHQAGDRQRRRLFLICTSFNTSKLIPE